mmetsp:Transcript_16180/g.37175  ORF Transcript_16180/g.37175 Transcript_16180/m.37175 type:complete len:314 (+) Transcript_16180:591-1532(+)
MRNLVPSSACLSNVGVANLTASMMASPFAMYSGRGINAHAESAPPSCETPWVAFHELGNNTPGSLESKVVLMNKAIRSCLIADSSRNKSRNLLTRSMLVSGGTNLAPSHLRSHTAGLKSSLNKQRSSSSKTLSCSSITFLRKSSPYWKQASFSYPSNSAPCASILTGWDRLNCSNPKSTPANEACAMEVMGATADKGGTPTDTRGLRGGLGALDTRGRHAWVVGHTAAYSSGGGAALMGRVGGRAGTICCSSRYCCGIALPCAEGAAALTLATPRPSLGTKRDDLLVTPTAARLSTIGMVSKRKSSNPKVTPP